MGKTPKPLYIVITEKAMREWPEVQKLFEQQHSIVWAGDFAWDALTPDLVVGPNCHRMDATLRKWFKNAIAEGRRRRYPAKPGSVPEVDDED